MATITNVPVMWLESRSQWVAKSTEYYKGETFLVSGSSRLGKTQARNAWKRNLDKRIAAIDRKEDNAAGRVKLEKAIWQWYETYKREDGRTERTIQTDEDTITQICREMGNIAVCDLDSDTIQRYFTRIARTASDSTCRKRWNMLSMFLRHEYPESGNPMARCTRTPSRKRKNVWEDEDNDAPSAKRSYTDEEMSILAGELRKPYDEERNGYKDNIGYAAGPALVVCMYEFLRISELTELRVKDVLWEDENHKLVVPPKYGSRRKVPIMAECRDILREACKGKAPCDLLFQSVRSSCGGPLAHEGHFMQRTLRDNLKRACACAGLEEHTVHDLRHDGISRLTRMKAQTVKDGEKVMTLLDPKSVSRWAGHKTVAVTMNKYYRHDAKEDEVELRIVCGG